MTLELIEQRLTALEQEVSTLKRRVEGPPLAADHPTRENGTVNPATKAASTESSNPWLRIAGVLDKDDPLVQEWIEIMKENRKKADEDPDYP